MPIDEAAELHKLDTRLLAALGARSRQGDGDRDRVAAAVVFTGDLDPLRQAGFDAPTMVHHPGRGVNIAAGSIAVGRLPALAALDQVMAVEGARAMKPEIDDSVPLIGATLLHQGIGFLPALKGAGVVIGIIDFGFDLSHKTLRNASEHTRIMALWDQTLGPPVQPLQPGETSPSPFNHGIEYSRDLAALERCGSAGLRSDLDRYGGAFAGFVRRAVHCLGALEPAALEPTAGAAAACDPAAWDPAAREPAA
jgi:hypothetical protein